MVTSTLTHNKHSAQITVQTTLLVTETDSISSKLHPPTVNQVTNVEPQCMLQIWISQVNCRKLSESSPGLSLLFYPLFAANSLHLLNREIESTTALQSKVADLQSRLESTQHKLA